MLYDAPTPGCGIIDQVLQWLFGFTTVSCEEDGGDEDDD